MLITDAEVIERAKTAVLPNIAFAVSGRAKDVALVLSAVATSGVGRSGYGDIAYPEPVTCEIVEFHTIDAEQDATEWAIKALAFFNSTLQEGEPARALVRVIELGPTNAHVYVRLPAGGSGGELFKCSKCGLVTHGSPTFSGVGAPYRLAPPPQRDQNMRRRFYAQCGQAA